MTLLSTANLADVFAKGAMYAAAKIIADKNLKVADADVTAALKERVFDCYEGTVVELREADACFMGEAMLREILNTAIIACAIAALRAVPGGLPAGTTFAH